MKKTADLRIRLEEADLARIKRHADSKRLPVSTLVRQQILDAADEWDNERANQAVEKSMTGGRRR